MSKVSLNQVAKNLLPQITGGVEIDLTTLRSGILDLVRQSFPNVTNVKWGTAAVAARNEAQGPAGAPVALTASVGDSSSALVVVLAVATQAEDDSA
jgi:hypothetical protein